MWHIGDADGHQIAPVLVDRAKHERVPPRHVLVSKCIPSAAMSLAMNLVMNLEQTSGGIKIQDRIHIPKTQAPEDALLLPRHWSQYRIHGMRLFPS